VFCAGAQVKSLAERGKAFEAEFKRGRDGHDTARWLQQGVTICGVIMLGGGVIGMAPIRPVRETMGVERGSAAAMMVAAVDGPGQARSGALF
jgi:hypothetical protein